jgi:hypothetical protein
MNSAIKMYKLLVVGICFVTLWTAIIACRVKIKKNFVSKHFLSSKNKCEKGDSGGNPINEVLSEKD